MTKWVQIFGGTVTHTYYSLESYYISKIKTYEKGSYTYSAKNLYIEWFTFDTIQLDQSRTVLSFFQILGNVGGVQQVFLFMFGFILSYYSEISFMIDAINNMYAIETLDTSL